MGSQTDTHILGYNVVRDYEWNEWELRRKALKMVKKDKNLSVPYLTKTLNIEIQNFKSNRRTLDRK